MLYRITSKFFVAGIIIEDATVVDAAPIVAYLIGRDEQFVRAYATKRGWEIECADSGYGA